MRTFIAIRVPATDQLVTASRQLSALLSPRNIVPPEQWHATLQFLGGTAEHLIPRLVSIVTAIAATECAQTVTIRGLGAFPNLARPTVLWAGFFDAAVLTRMATQLALQCQNLGFSRETRPFQPHLTLARVKSRPSEPLAELIRSNHELDLGHVKVASLELFRSDLTSTGPEYTAIASAPLLHDGA